MTRHTGFRCLETWVSYVLNQDMTGGSTQGLHGTLLVRIFRYVAGSPGVRLRGRFVGLVEALLTSMRTTDINGGNGVSFEGAGEGPACHRRPPDRCRSENRTPGWPDTPQPARPLRP